MFSQAFPAKSNAVGWAGRCPSCARTALSSSQAFCTCCAEAEQAHSQSISPNHGPSCPVACTGAGACTKCAYGTYAPSAGATVCLACSAGTTANATGATSCYTCPPGYIEQNRQSCLSCLVGQYSASPGSVACQNCSVGKYAANAASTTCGACTPGQVCAVSQDCVRAGVLV